MAHRAEEHEEMEDGVHEPLLVKAVEHGARDVAHTLGDDPRHGGGVDTVDERSEGHEHTEAHDHETHGLYTTVTLQTTEALYRARDGGEPDEDEECPTPIAIFAHGDERDGRVGARDVPVDGGVVPLAQPLLPWRPGADGVIHCRSHIRAEHAEEVEDDACCGPSVACPSAPHEEHRAYDESQDYSRSV